jgi:5-methylcytosine-specific restriction endonuclease McrA
MAMLEYQRIRRQKRLAQNQCCDCAQPVVHGRCRCEYHIILHAVQSISSGYKRVYNKNLPVTLGTKERSHLAEKLYKRYLKNPYCCFTSEPLFIGINSNLDHIAPIAQYPELAYDFANLQLVSDTYNKAKGNRTDAEFNRHYKITYIP